MANTTSIIFASCSRPAIAPANIKSAERTILLLRHFAAVRLPQRFSELCKSLGLPKSSCTGLLETLIDLGILSYNFSTRLYFPTEDVRALGEWLAPPTDLQEQATAAARRLHLAVGETVSLARPLGIHLQWLFVAASDRHATPNPQGAQRVVPLCDTPAALPLLARRSDIELEDLICAHNDYFSGRHQISPRSLIEQARAARGRPLVSATATKRSEGFVSACLSDFDKPEEYLLAVFAPPSRIQAAEAAALQIVSAFLEERAL